MVSKKQQKNINNNGELPYLKMYGQCDRYLNMHDAALRYFTASLTHIYYIKNDNVHLLAFGKGDTMTLDSYFQTQFKIRRANVWYIYTHI